MVAIDPTKNVLDLVAAQALLTTEKIDGLRREADLRAGHASEMREAEAKRIDAILASNLAESRLSNERATTTATVLAASQAATAETLRTLVANTERATSERISALERSSYEGRGKGAGAGDLWKVLASVLGLAFTGVMVFFALGGA